MVDLTGMDIAHVRTMAREMAAEATEIRSMLQAMTHDLQGAAWSGRDRQAFVDEWNNTHARSLARAADSLQAASTEARKYAEQQEWASRA